MDKNFLLLKLEFNRIRNMGWIKSRRNGFSGVGCTFENLLGYMENELEIPDYNGIEIKTTRKNANTKTHITLFSSTPEGPHYHEIERIKNIYGYPYYKCRRFKVLNQRVYANFKNKIGLNFYFKLFVDYRKEKIFLVVYDLQNNVLENDTYWCFDTLKEKLYRKLQFLAVIEAQNRFIEGNEYFYYQSLKIYKLKSFDIFIKLIEMGVVNISFKINVFMKGTKIGKIHDHGTGFEISKINLSKLFDIL